MIGLRDNFTLSFTKLRTRRIRLIVTLIVSGLLFAVLILASLLIRGNLASLTKFTKEGFTSRFLVAVYPPQGMSDAYDPALVARAQAIQKTLVAQKTAEAKRLGVPYDSATEEKSTFEGGPEGPKQVGVNTTLAAGKQAYTELHPPIDYPAKIRQAATGYHLTNIYTGSSLAGADQNKLHLNTIVNGAEVKTGQNYNLDGDPLENFSTSLSSLDDSLLKPFLLEGATLQSGPGQAIPILAPVTAAEKLLKLTPLSSKATTTEKLARLTELRAKARNFEFSVCSRNQEASELRDLVKQQATEMAAQKNTPGYTAPKVQYAAATTPCSPVVTSKDTRTADEKAADAKLEEFKAKFGGQSPQTAVVKFRIVGLLPQINYGAAAFDLSSLFSSLVTSTLGQGWYMSHAVALADPVMGPILKENLSSGSNGQQYYAEFADRVAQKRFLDDRACQPKGNGSIADCLKNNNFMLAPYGNPLAAIYDNQKDFRDFLNNVVLVIAVLSALIMMGTVGKIIADSRKETSVFRAVGAKRLDIAQIYLLYAAMLSVLAFLIALGIGLGVALLFETSYSPGLSIQAVLAFNSSNIHQTYHLIGLNALDLLQIFALTLAAGLASASIPLLTNMRRNPIKDMREE